VYENAIPAPSDDCTWTLGTEETAVFGGQLVIPDDGAASAVRAANKTRTSAALALVARYLIR
jgi:hypothetical protein